jgi:maleamate amidohydrolase
MVDEQDLRDDYLRAGFSGTLGRGSRRALLLVDLTYAYLDPASPLYAGEGGAAVVAACAKLLQAARSSGAPVIHTRIVLSPGGMDGGLFVRKVPSLAMFYDRDGFSKTPPELEPAPGELVLAKQYASAFFGTSLASSLRVLGADAVVIAGASTSGCVRASGVDAMQHGFIPLVVADGCLDRDARPHEAALFDLEAKYAEVITSDEGCQLLGSHGVKAGG